MCSKASNSAFFLLHVLVVCVMASEDHSKDNSILVDNGQSECKKHVLELLDDTEARKFMIQKLREVGYVARDPPSSGAGVFPPPSMCTMFPSMSNATSSWPKFPFPVATLFPQYWGPAASTPTDMGQSLPGSASLLGQPGSGSSPG